jgi:hypothetical protein
MASIDIDFDVFKELTVRRAHEGVSHNDVLRELLGLDDADHQTAPLDTLGCYLKGVFFPENTAFRVSYKGKTHTAEIKGGAWIGDDGQPRNSPSEAAHAVTGNNVNGWRFWEGRRPGEDAWRKLDAFR